MRSHLDKLARDLQIQALHPFQIVQILIKNIRHTQIPDFDLIFLKEHQDQAQRPFKVLHAVLIPDNPFQVETWIFHSNLIHSSDEMQPPQSETAVRRRPGSGG